MIWAYSTCIQQARHAGTGKLTEHRFVAGLAFACAASARVPCASRADWRPQVAGVGTHVVGFAAAAAARARADGFLTR
jgi:hypothetical protein